MVYVAFRMLVGDRWKYTALLLGIAFTAFLVSFAGSYFAGFMTRGFALIAENGDVDVWVMDPAVESTEQTINMPDSILSRVRGVAGVRSAVPLSLSTAEVRFPGGRFQEFQVIGVDDALLEGAPSLDGQRPPPELRGPNAVVVDAGGTIGKLQTPLRAIDQWPHDGPHLDAPARTLRRGDVLFANDRRIDVAGVSHTLPRFPPRPLLYTRYSNAKLVSLTGPHMLTFVLVRAAPGIEPAALARRIGRQTGMKARSSAEFTADTVRWYLVNSEDVGDMAAMMILAMTVGFGVTGVMLFMFTYENLKQYAVLHAMGAERRTLMWMTLAQSALCALLGTGFGLPVCALAGAIVTPFGYPFRMMWFTPLFGAIGVAVVSLTAALISIRPVLNVEPAAAFAGR